MFILRVKSSTRDLRNLMISASTLLMVQIVFSVLLNLSDLVLGSNILVAGVLAFSVIILYSADLLIDKNITSSRLRLQANIVVKILSSIVLFVLVLEVLKIKLLLDVATSAQRFAGFFAVLIIIISSLLLNQTTNFIDTLMKHKKVLLLFLPLLLIGFASAQDLNNTTATINSVGSTLTSISALIQNVTTFGQFLWQQQSLVSQSLGLDETQSLIALGIIVLLAVIFAARFLESIAKWLIIVLVGILVLLLVT